MTLAKAGIVLTVYTLRLLFHVEILEYFIIKLFFVDEEWQSTCGGGFGIIFLAKFGFVTVVAKTVTGSKIVLLCNCYCFNVCC